LAFKLKGRLPLRRELGRSPSERAAMIGARPAVGKRLAVIQSSYIPWKGYFDIIGMVDEFVFFDDAQFTRRDWRNRNKIKTAQGLQWLTIPVASKGRYFQAIDETEITEPWIEKHWRSLTVNYQRAAHFQALAPAIRAIYEDVAGERYLSRVNARLVAGLCRLLDIATPLRWSRDYPVVGAKSERLLSICRAAGAALYLSGPSARSYLDIDLFASEGIAVEWMDYEGYPAYPQLFGTFEHGVSILDLLFNTGAEGRRYMKCGTR
jgi:hypothetical protein